MRKTIIVLIFLEYGLILSGQGFKQQTYTANDSVITNPERGFFHFTSVSSNGSYDPLDLATLTDYRNNGISVIFREFYLDGNVSSDIQPGYLQGMEQDFKTLRQAGLKAVIRFSYTDKSTKPYGDASLNRILRHIQQLKPVLQRNSDVILVLQAGFIGAWGEWYYTDYFSQSPGVIYPEQWDMRREVVNALLDALPVNRQIEVRTPQYKWELLNDTSAISAEQAYTAIPKARIAHHNDCFVSSSTDYGTYSDTATEKKYLERDSRYTLVSGETCNTCSPCSDCSNAQAELARFHWTALNLDYNQEVLGSWRSQGCFETVTRRLGYRYRFISSSVQQSAKPGGTFHFVLNMMNDGYSNPVNPRKVECILRNAITKQEYEADFTGDPRFWPLNDTIRIDFSAGIPSYMPVGDYQVFFNMPDSDIRLHDMPAFSIRMANNEVWEQGSGMNNLNAVCSVMQNSALPDYSSTTFFRPRKETILEDSHILIDGNSKDWAGILPVAEKDSHSLRTVNVCDSLFFIATGSNLKAVFRLFIDADRDIETGYNAWPWTDNGADYMVENGILYRYSGTSHEWGWQEIGSVAIAQNDSIIELGFPVSYLQPIIPDAGYALAFVSDPQGTTPFFLPEANSAFANNPMLLRPIPEVRAVSWNGNAIFYWQGTDKEGVYTVIERTGNNSSFTTRTILMGSEISFQDTGLNPTSAYTYRFYRMNSNQISPAVTISGIVGTGSVSDFLNIRCDGDSTDWTIVPPLATCFISRTIPMRVANYGDSLFFGIQGISEKDTIRIYLNTDEDVLTGNTNPFTKREGYDYLISSDSLYSANGHNAWAYTGKIVRYLADGFLEIACPLETIGMGNSVSCYIAGAINHDRIPDLADEIEFLKMNAPGIPAYFQVLNSQTLPYTRIILQWARSSDATGYVVERSADDESHFFELTRLPVNTTYYHDNSVDSSHIYYYRMFAFNGAQRSGYTQTYGGKPGSILEGMANPSTGNSMKVCIFPNPVTNTGEIQVENMSGGIVTCTLYDLTGRPLVQVFKGWLPEGQRVLFYRNSLLSGVYVLEVANDHGNRGQVKVILQ